jgi:ParB-like chromosome segregation protein Spo0J
MPSIRYVSLADLKPWPGAARAHSKKQIHQIAESIRRFGFINPIVIDEDQQILAGHGRVEAARTMKLEEVPSLRIDTMSEAEKRAYVITDNKLALNAGWDQTFLGNELERLLAEDLHFDIGITGFSISDSVARSLTGQLGGPSATREDQQIR